jgi:hypothetical protein
MSLLSFDVFSKLSEFTSGWTRLTGDRTNEGISIDDQNRVGVDFEKDEETDVIRLETASELKSSKKEGIPVYVGYSAKAAKTADEKLRRAKFLETVKKWGAIDEDNLKALIDRTYPQELREMGRSVKLIFITGSSEPLASNIASALKEMYHPDAKIIDVLKKYYGVDIKSIIDWEAYEKADDTTKEMIDSYLRGASYRGDLRNMPRWVFDGFIKKSAGLKSGARRILKPGHSIDQMIINEINEVESEWRKKTYANPNINVNMQLRLLPKYLVVDDTIIEGSTMKGIFREFMSPKISGSIDSAVGQIDDRLYGYALFTARAVN